MNDKVSLEFHSYEGFKEVLNVLKFFISGMGPDAPHSDYTVDNVLELLTINQDQESEFKNNMTVLGKFYPTRTKHAAQYYTDFAWPYDKSVSQEGGE